MKALGIIRKIDDLGRLVIPKEVRDTQKWPSGQAMEMFMTDEGLLIKPYQIGEEKEKALDILDRVMGLAIQQSDEGLQEELLQVIQYVEGK